MAILRGFPPSNTISPSVRITEKDLSFVSAQTQLNSVGVVGFASKGPINIPTIVASRRQLNTIFGFPHPESGDPYMIYAGQQYLNVSNRLYVVRVADEDEVSDERAKIAQVEIPSAGSKIEVESDTAGPYTFAVDSFFRWRLNGVLSSKTLVALADTYSTDDLVTFLNNQLNGDFDGIEFYTAAGDKIAVRTVFAHGPDSSFEMVSVQQAMYGGAVIDGNVTGLGTLITQAETIGDMDRYPNNGYQSAGEFDLSGLSDLTIEIVIDGTDNVNIDNVVQTIDLADLEGAEWTVGQVVTEVNSQRESEGGNLPGGWEAFASGDQLSFRTLHHGRDARLLVKSESTANDIFGFDNLTAVGTSPTGTTGDAAVHTYGIIDGGANLTGEVTFVITADTAGIDGNGTQVVITNNIREANFNIEVYNNGGQVEAWGGLSKSETSRFYVESFLALVSEWIRAVDDTSITAPPLDGTYTLAGGADGIPSDPDD